MTYKEFAIETAKKAGEIMLKNFKLGMEKKWKADGTPVTETDIAINRMVIESVQKNFPGHDVLGEEESSRANGGEFLWVCDPVDGTVPFSHGIPTFVFSLALVQNGIPIVGVIYDPVMDRMYFAEKGQGATLNGKPIHVNDQTMEHGVVGWASKSVHKLKDKYPATPALNLWCICYEGVLIASGELTATLFSGQNSHDVAALKVIVEEAGGRVTDRDGNEQRYDGKINGALISNGVVHEELLEVARA